MKSKCKGRKGFSLVELLIAIVVLGILASMLINSGVSAQKKARVTAALTCLKDYEAAFSTTCLTNPGVMKDREDAWGDDGTAYTTKAAMERLVSKMNESLDDKTKFMWDDTMLCYRSVGEDPWGGRYIITEYPYVNDTAPGYDPTVAGSVGQSAMRLAIWATGVDGSIETGKTVHDGSVGVALEYRGGYTSSTYQGVNDSYPFSAKGSPEGTDYIIRY